MREATVPRIHEAVEGRPEQKPDEDMPGYSMQQLPKPMPEKKKPEKVIDPDAPPPRDPHPTVKDAFGEDVPASLSPLIGFDQPEMPIGQYNPFPTTQMIVGP